jgi:hypothetical protein
MTASDEVRAAVYRPQRQPTSFVRVLPQNPAPSLTCSVTAMRADIRYGQHALRTVVRPILILRGCWKARKRR